MLLNATLLILSSLISLSSSARILGIVSTPSYSHHVPFHALWRELSLKGHQLTVITTDPLNDPTFTNLTEIDLHQSYAIWNRNLLDMINNQENFFTMINTGSAVFSEIYEFQLGHPDVQALIKNETEHFDLVIVEALSPGMFVFAERFKCPFIGMTSLEAPHEIFAAIGNPVHPVLNPEFMLPFSGTLSFFERVVSVLFVWFIKIYSFYYIPSQDEIVKKYFGNGYPSLGDIPQNMSMLFVNADPIFHATRPVVPAVIQIGGGSNRLPGKPLPKDLQEVLDSAKQGFIYFSLGTNVKSKDLSESNLKSILDAFGELPYLVLWKFELEELRGKPKNVVTSKWFPQPDVFRHPNIKLFITQGGLQSMEEAVYAHIPMIGIPFFADQPSNVKQLVTKGLGLKIDHTKLDKETFKETILEVINNPKYRNRVKELASLAQDQPMTGLEKAVWWTEYVLRHNGARHLRSPAIDIPFYQYYLLDVIGFCLLCVLILFYLLIVLVKLVLRIVRYFTITPKLKMQ